MSASARFRRGRCRSSCRSAASGSRCYANGERVAQGQVSTGVPGHPTPLGVFSVIEKDRHHHSNIYSGAPMPFMQRITWSGIALHEGALPGHPASHGCIRLSRDFAQKLWPTTKLGARVIVARTELAPSDFAHPKLFVPRAKPAVEPVAHLGRPVRLAQNEVPPSDAATATDAQPLEPAAPAATAETRAADVAKPAEVPAPAAADATETAAKPVDDAQDQIARTTNQLPTVRSPTRRLPIMRPPTRRSNRPAACRRRSLPPRRRLNCAGRSRRRSRLKHPSRSRRRSPLKRRSLPNR